MRLPGMYKCRSCWCAWGRRPDGRTASKGSSQNQCLICGVERSLAREGIADGTKVPVRAPRDRWRLAGYQDIGPKARPSWRGGGGEVGVWAVEPIAGRHGRGECGPARRRRSQGGVARLSCLPLRRVGGPGCRGSRRVGLVFRMGLCLSSPGRQVGGPGRRGPAPPSLEHRRSRCPIAPPCFERGLGRPLG